MHPPELLDFIEAEYPPAAFAEGVGGTVMLRLDIDADGRVAGAEVMEPAGLGFDDAALAAAQRFRFRAARRGSTPVRSRILYRYEFRLPQPRVEQPPQSAGSRAPKAREQRAPERHALHRKEPAQRTPVEVTVRGVSVAQRLRESMQAVKVIETETAQRQTADLGEILARTEGVGVQRSGGLGSQDRLSLHGLTGEQIRVFLDGVPLDFSGFGLGVSIVPVSWLERVEVYRGVVPIRLGADALGGAIDLVTDQSLSGTALAASYMTGAFDTHQLGVSARTQDPATGLFVRSAYFLESSANDYLVDVRVPDDLGRLRPARVRRFHDGYEARGGMVEGGLVDRPWARRLLLRVFATDFEKDLQHNATMSVPYGKVGFGQFSVGGTVRYEQPRLGGTPLSVSLMAGFGRRTLSFQDKSRWVYDWFGNTIYERDTLAGELRPFASDLMQWENRWLGRAVVTYHLADGHAVRWVVTPDLSRRTGEERLRLRPERIDPLTTRRSIFQLTSGLEYEARGMSDRLENSVFGKYYLYEPASDQVETFDNSIRHLDDSTVRFGAGDAVRFRILDGVIAKLSYEYATRLPRPDEVFGDGVLVRPNLQLDPETSHNANIGLRVGRDLPVALGTVSFEATGFLRDTENMIVRLLAQDRVHEIHQNLYSARTLGVDGTFGWVSPRRWLSLNANATWQEQRNSSTKGAFAPFDGQRIPNRPWLFANASAVVRWARFAARNAALSLSWTTRYVHDFLAGWEETTPADDTWLIPSQLTHALGLVYSVVGPVSVDCALDVSNITNDRVYDELRAQRPGRAAFFKVTVGWSDSSENTDWEQTE